MPYFEQNVLNKEYYINTDAIIGNAIWSFLSFLGSMLVIYISFKIHSLKSIIYSLITIISISELINSINHFISSLVQYRTKEDDIVRNKGLLYCQILVTILTDTLTMLYLLTICFCIYKIVKSGSNSLANFKKFIVVIPLLISIIFSVIVFLWYILKYPIKKGDDFYENVRIDIYLTWGWIKNRYNTKGGKVHPKIKYLPSNFKYDIPGALILTFIFYWLIIICMVLLCVKVYKIVNSSKKLLQKSFTTFNSINKLLSILFSYPIVGVIWWVFTTINIFVPFDIYYHDKYSYSIADRASFIILALRGLFTCSRGVMVFMIYAFGDKAQKILLDKLSAILNICSKNKDIKLVYKNKVPVIEDSTLSAINLDI